MLDLQTVGQQLSDNAEKGALVELHNASGELIEGAWIRVRGTSAPALKALAQKNQREAANLEAGGRGKELYDVTRREKKTNELLVAAFIEAGPMVGYRGEPLTKANIAAALADPLTEKTLQIPMLLVCSNAENFLTATASTSTLISPSTSKPAPLPISSPSSAASSN